MRTDMRCGAADGTIFADPGYDPNEYHDPMPEADADEEEPSTGGNSP